MGVRTKIEIGIAAAMAAILLVCIAQHRRIQWLTGERDRYRGNTEALLSDIKTYQTKDSLNAARIDALRLTVKEFERFRAEDAALIKTLKARNGTLQAVTTAQSELIAQLRATPKDTVIIRDSIKIPARVVACGDYWYSFKGVMTEQDFTGTLQSRDSILIAETVKYKRFLGFLWKTNKIKSRNVDIVSKNPHNKIVGFEYIRIEK